MSRDASITLDWADGTYHFRLGWAELEKLQEACNAGPFLILERLQSADCRLEDIAEVLRWALVGGGKVPSAATQLVRFYVQGRPPAENRLFALSVLSAGCYGAPEEQIEKKPPAPDQGVASTTFQTENSGSEPSTELAPS